ncbi:MAG: hypothetical protein AAFU84_10565 [Cyanobacteria bacterium J06633_23]
MMKSNVKGFRAANSRERLVGRTRKTCDRNPRTYTIYQRQQKLSARLGRFFQFYNPLNYHIHMGWFGGLRIYSKTQYFQSRSHEYR